MKRLLCVLGIGTGALFVGCAEDPSGPTTGSISLRLLSPPASASDGSLAQAPAEPVNHLQSLRVTVDGPTQKAQTFQCTTSSCEGTVEGLAPGSYSVIVEGLVGTEVDHFGQTSGVTVTAGATAQATIAFLSFQPVLASFATDTTEVLHFTVSYAAVPNATSYRVEWAKAADFGGASSLTLTGTSTEITVTEEAQYYVRVRAVNSVVTANGRWSTSKSVVALLGVATVTVTPATTTIAPGATQAFSAEARDADNNVVSGVSFFWSSSDHNVATVSQSGLATGVSGGTASITAMAKGTPGSVLLTVSQQVATQLVFTVEPNATAVTGGAMSPALEVEIRDAVGKLVRSARGAVTLTIGTNPPGDARLSGTTEVHAVNGVATFSGLAINKAGLGYTLTASAGGLPDASSAAFDVTSAIVIYRDAPAWGNGEELVLRSDPFNFKSGEDYWVRPMVDLQLGIPAGVRVVILPSNADGIAAQSIAQNHPDAQAALDAFVQGGGWLVGHLGDNLAEDYKIPGLTGVADETTSCTGLTLSTTNHSLVFGPNEMVGGGDDLNNANIDTGGVGWCSEVHGSLAGILPGGATVLMTEQAGGVRPVYATYALGQGRVIVTTTTLEGMASWTTPMPGLLRNHFYWALRGAGAPVSASPVFAEGMYTSAAPVGPSDQWVSSTRRR